MNKLQMRFIIGFLVIFGVILINITTVQSDERVEELIKKLENKNKNIRNEAVDELAKLNWEQLKGNCITENCHIKIDKKIKNASVAHKPAVEGKCRDCHNTHGSERKYYLIKEKSELCFICHESIKKIINGRKYKHDPIKKGNCVICHDPHGSVNIKILRRRMSEPSEFKTGDILCFGCHQRKPWYAFNDPTTDFKNGKKILHAPLHGSKLKEVKCNECHDAHASDQQKHIIDDVIFFKTPTGGKCEVKCHKTRAYDRENPVPEEEWY